MTKYIDIETVDVSRGDVLNTISYKFQEPTTILNIQFKENNQIAYGDEDAELRDENGKLLANWKLDKNSLDQQNDRCINHLYEIFSKYNAMEASADAH